MKSKIFLEIPKEVLNICQKLKDHNFESYIIGGSIRDILIGKKPNDWDITTNAKPNEIQDIFDNSIYKNNFGTVSIINKEASDKSLEIIEITTYRIESDYLINRKPSEISFTQILEEDLKRRDFTINAIAYDPLENNIIDIFLGINDLQNKQIKSINKASDRFQEDPLRIIRAVRLAGDLNFKIEEQTLLSIVEHEKLLKNISQERIRDEFIKIILSNNIEKSIIVLQETNLLKYISIELLDSINVTQNKNHKYDVFTHLLKSAQHAANKNYSLEIRLAALFHDVSKPETRRWLKDKNDWSFYNHEVLGAKKVYKILKRLRFPEKQIIKISLLVRWHMFFSDPDKITLSAIKRLVKNIGGHQDIYNLIKLRVCDRIGMGRPKEKTYRLRKYESMIEEASRIPVSVRNLEINGQQIMDLLFEKPGKKIGSILNILMEEILKNSNNNNYNFLREKTLQISQLSEAEIQEKSKKAKLHIKIEDDLKVKDIRKKYFVK